MNERIKQDVFRLHLPRHCVCFFRKRLCASSNILVAKFNSRENYQNLVVSFSFLAFYLFSICYRFFYWLNFNKIRVNGQYSHKINPRYPATQPSRLFALISMRIYLIRFFINMHYCSSPASANIVA